MQIEDYLHGKKLHLALLGRKPENMDKEEWVRLTLRRKVAYNVIQKRSIVGLMTAMYDMYEKLSANNKVYLMKNLFNLKMTERMSITQHLIISTLSRINCYMVKLNLMMSYEHWCCWLHFQIVGRLCNSAEKSKLNYDNIRDLILREEHKKDSGDSLAFGSTLNLEMRGRRFDRYSNHGRLKSRPKSRQGRSKSRFRKQVECWHCGKPGHI